MMSNEQLEPRERKSRESILAALSCIDVSESAEIYAQSVIVSDDGSSVRHVSGELIVLRFGQHSYLPSFQLDRDTGATHDSVRYCNRLLLASNDPWSVAEWWITPSRVLSGQTPLSAFRSGDLTTDVMDKVVKYELT